MARSRSIEGARPTLEPRRSWGQRFLIAVGAVMAVTALLAASVAGWLLWQMQAIDREDVQLDSRLPDEATNYLIVGSDSRVDRELDDAGGGDDGRAALADTIMIVRIDPGSEAVRLLSVPRDLWVTLPNGDKGRINAAYAPGPQHLIDTVRDELDVPVHHYVAVDFQGFEEVVSAIDGVPVWFDRSVRDLGSGLNVPEAGCVTLDGSGALAFARSRQLQFLTDAGSYRYDGTGDLGRVNRQQQFLRRVADRARSRGISNPATARRLVEAGTSNLTLDDDLAVTELVALSSHFAEFDSDSLETYTLPTTPRTTAGGAMVLDPDAESMESVLALFRDGAPAQSPFPAPATTTPPTTSSTIPRDLPQPGAVSLSVWNGTDQQGLAHSVADDLAANGFGVVETGNASTIGITGVPETVVHHGSGAEADARSAAVRLPGEVEVVLDTSLSAGAVAVVVGPDLSEAASTTTTTTSTTTTTTVPAESEIPAQVGLVPIGHPPDGEACG